MGGKVCLRCKGKTLLVIVNNHLKTKSLLTSPRNVLPLHLKQTFPPIIWIFTEGEGHGIESRLPFKIFSTLPWRKNLDLWHFVLFQIQQEIPEIESKPVRWKLVSWESKFCWFVTNPSWIRSGFELLEPSRTWATGLDLRYFLKLRPIFLVPVLCQFTK